MESLARTANRGSISTGYDIGNSYKNENDNAEKMTHTYDSAPTSQKKGTISMWFKRTEIESNIGLFQFGDNASGNYLALRWGRDIYGSLETYGMRIAGTNFSVGNPYGAVRDTSAFYHVVVAIDTTQATATNRFKVYRNGVELGWSTDNRANITQNADLAIGENGKDVIIGEGVYRYNGYIAEVNYVDGQQLTSTDFGEYDSDSGIWIPKKYTGTYGNNGFYLDFSNASNLGEDQSGNNHDFSLTNITASNQSVDTPTNNFCTWLSDGTFFNGTNDSVTTKEGGTVIKRNANTQWITAHATQAVNNGKWYYEAKVIAQKNCMIGASPVDAIIGATNSVSYLGQGTDGTIGFQFSDGNLFYHTGYTNYVSGGLSTDDIVGFALDMDNNKCYVSVNGTYVNSADPANGTNGFSILDKEYIFATATYAPNQEYPFNIGGYTTISISSGESDANGYGTFEYAPPSGYYALCTKNLAEYG